VCVWSFGVRSFGVRDGTVWVWGEDDDVAGGSSESCVGDGGDGGGAVWVRVWVLW
jgi:hypothetical protein